MGYTTYECLLSNQHSVNLLYVMSQKGVCHFSRKMIVILHKILFNGSISDHKNTFYDFFSGVQYVSPTFKAGSLVCDTQHLL